MTATSTTFGAARTIFGTIYMAAFWSRSLSRLSGSLRGIAPPVFLCRADSWKRFSAEWHKLGDHWTKLVAPNDIGKFTRRSPRGVGCR